MPGASYLSHRFLRFGLPIRSSAPTSLITSTFQFSNQCSSLFCASLQSRSRLLLAERLAHCWSLTNPASDRGFTIRLRIFQNPIRHNASLWDLPLGLTPRGDESLTSSGLLREFLEDQVLSVPSATLADSFWLATVFCLTVPP